MRASCFGFISLTLVGSSVFALGCAVDTEERELTREQARALGGRSDAGADLCEIFDWYGDGICDDFCVEPDSDCSSCAAVPSCGDGEVEHGRWEDCPADSSCREVTECGATIWCSDTGTCAAVPSCGDGEVEHEREEDCPADSSCRAVTECGATIWCSDTATCAGFPSCGSAETEHARWEDCPADSSCREVTECGATIWCSDTATCAGFPSCGTGETEHARWEDCPADTSCREVIECGASIWCSSDEAAECFGENPQGCSSSGCDEGFHCDTSMGTAPSACACSPESGTWECTADVSGGVCVADED